MPSVVLMEWVLVLSLLEPFSSSASFFSSEAR
jgi:hypothetical protein